MLLVGALRRGAVRHPARRADAAAARRLPGDRDPGVRRDRAGRLPQLGQVHQRHERHHGHRQPSLLRLPGIGGFGLRQPVAVLRHRRGLIIAIVMIFLYRLRGLAAGPGLDGDPRGRARGRQHGHQHGHHQAARLRDRRVDRRASPACSSPRSSVVVDPTSSTSRSRSPSSRWSSSAAWATSGASRSGAFIDLRDPDQGLKQLDQLLRTSSPGPDRLSDVNFIQLPVPALRPGARADDAAATRGPVPEPTATAGAARRDDRRGPSSDRAGDRGSAPTMEARVPASRAAARRPTAPAASSTRSAVTKRFGGLVAVNAVDFDDPGGLDRQPDRAERRRQDDVLQRHRRALRPDASGSIEFRGDA